METIINSHGGKRSGSGRKPKNRNNKFTFRVSDEVAVILRSQKNYNDYIESLILGTVNTDDGGN